MGEYYAYRALSFFDSTSHILTLIAAMFTVTWIQRHNELTALEAAGILEVADHQADDRRGRAIIVGCKVANRELVIPAVRESLSHNAQDLGGSRGKQLMPRYDIETGVLLRASGPDLRQREADREAGLSTARRDWIGTARASSPRTPTIEPPKTVGPGGYLFRKV